MGLIGEKYAVSQQAMAEGMKGLVWAIELAGKWYEAEFTGEVSDEGRLFVMIKKSTKAPRGHDD